MTEESQLQVEQAGEVTVVGFNEPTLLNAYQVNESAKELYHLIEDPHERVNLIAECPDEARRLKHAFGTYFRLRNLPAVSQTQTKGVQGKYELASGSVPDAEERE